jgi:hypothetical protein
MTTTEAQYAYRVFKLWEYQVSHGQLLIRSPKSPATPSAPEQLTNVDLVCLGVEYLAVPRLFRGLELVSPTHEELGELEVLVGSKLEPADVRILLSQGRRFPVVASSFTLSENDWDIFESPFEFRSHFRGSK